MATAASACSWPYRVSRSTETVGALPVPMDRRLAASIIAIAGLVAACAPLSGPIGNGQPAEGSPVPDCYQVNESVDTPPRTIANLSRVTTSVVIAEVTAIEDGIWNTRDGRKPGGSAPGAPGSSAGIVTPTNLDIERSVRGDAGPGALRVLNPGGTAGCVTHIVDNAPRIVIGGRYAFFLQPAADAEGVRHPDVLQIVEAWPVSEDGLVETLHDGVLALDDFEAAVANPVQPSTTPEPTPAGPDNPG